MVKENDGKKWIHRQRSRRLILGVVVIVSVGLALLRVVSPRMGRFSHGGVKSLHVASSAKVSTPIYSDPHHPQERAILEGKYFLIELDISFGALTDKGEKNKTHYSSVAGTFCPLDWSLQKTNPSLVPMFRSLVSESKHCKSNRVTVDLRDMAKKARLYDKSVVETAKKGAPSGAVLVKPLKLGGVAFHESRCGSTLVANLLVASNPTSHRIYSESQPPIQALRACTSPEAKCSRTKQVALLRDVVYLMSRSQSSRETHVFFKIQSVGVQSIDIFTQAFPETPWVFVYRDPVEVLMSHLKHGGEKTTQAVCLRSRSNPSALVKQLVSERSDQSSKPSELSTVQYCAAHLASLCLAALQEFRKKSGKGQFLNYASLPDIMWESILPNHFDVDGQVDDEQVERMKTIAQVYSKGFGVRGNLKWEGDSETKQQAASKSIRKAAETFLAPYYEEMEASNNKEDEEEGQVERKIR